MMWDEIADLSTKAKSVMVLVAVLGALIKPGYDIWKGARMAPENREILKAVHELSCQGAKNSALNYCEMHGLSATECREEIPNCSEAKPW